MTCGAWQDCVFAFQGVVSHGNYAVGGSLKHFEDRHKGLGGSTVVATRHGNQRVGAPCSARPRVL